MYLFIYLAIINVVAFIVWCTDKYLAVKQKYRISEKALFLWALAGGSLGSLCAMHMVRHKTKHLYFVIGIPIILILQVLAIVYVLSKYI